MPRASEHLRGLMYRWFGSIDEQGPSEFLFARGWNEYNGYWYKPTNSHTPSVYEVACLLFLRDEWDYDFPHNLYDRTADL